MLDDRFYVSHGPLLISEIIEGLGVTLPDPKFLDETISCMTRLEAGKPGSITFIGSKKSLKLLKRSKATACFVTEELAHYVGAEHIIPLVTKTPRAHFARSMAKFGYVKTLEGTSGAAQIAKSAKVHQSVVIGAGAIIGENVTISPNTVIGPGVSIAQGCSIGPNVSIQAALIGKNCVLKASVVIGGRGFGVDRDEIGMIDIPHFGRVIIGDDVQIGANSCIDRGQLGDTILDDCVKIDNLVQIAHNVEIGEGSCLAAFTGISGSCKIGRNVMMGGAVGLADHLEIGDNVFIAARSGVMHNIPEGEKWGGTPAQPMGDWMREIATMRRQARRARKTADGS